MNNKNNYTLIGIFLIIILGFAVYVNSFKGEFIWDDHTLIENNIYIKNWSCLPNILTEDIAAGASAKFYYYRPLQILTYSIDYSFWRLNTIGYHLTNIVLHILTALCVWWLIYTLFKNKFISFITGIFFLIHPIHSEAIVYISGRADPLATLFMLLSFVLYIKYLNSKSKWVYFAVLSCYVSALLSRENSLILPIIFLLYSYTFKQKTNTKIAIPIISISCMYALMRLTLLKSLLPCAQETSDMFQRIPGFFIALTNYVRILIYPVNLHMEYENKLFGITQTKAIIGAIILVILLIYAIKKRESSKVVFFSIIWFLLTLLPSSNVLIPLSAFMSEHWLYLPSIGFFLLLANGLHYMYLRNGLKAITILITILLLIYYSFITVKQNTYWTDPLTLYERTVKYAPHSYIAKTLLGIEYKNMGRKDEAITLYKKAIELNPNYAEPYINLGVLYTELGKKEEAVTLYKKAIEINPSCPNPYNNLGIIYNALGKKEEALSSYRKAIEINPNYAKSYNNLGLLYCELGRTNEAIDFFNKTIKIDPTFADAYNNLGVLLYNLGEKKEAISLLKKAVEINPDHKEAYSNLNILSGKN